MRVVLIGAFGMFAYLGAHASTRRAEINVVGCLVDTIARDTVAVEGAQVLIRNADTTLSDSLGFYQLNIESAVLPTYLVARLVGYRPVERSVSTTNDRVVKLPLIIFVPGDDLVSNVPISEAERQRRQAEAERLQQRAVRLYPVCRRRVDSLRAPAP